MRYLIFGVCGFFLAGCALPVPFQIASWAISGISYATTGKSMSDHAISAVASRDCALHRIAFGDEVCSPSVLDDSDIAVASRNETGTGSSKASKGESSAATRLRESMISLAENLDNDFLPASGPDGALTGTDETDTSEKIDTVLLAMAETLNEIAPAGGSEQSLNPRRGDGKHYLIIGRYRQFKDAEQARGRYASLHTAVRMVLREGALLYQVTAGPFSRPDAIDAGATLASRNDTTPRVALLCANRVSAPPCAADEPVVQLTELPR